MQHTDGDNENDFDFNASETNQDQNSMRGGSIGGGFNTAGAFANHGGAASNPFIGHNVVGLSATENNDFKREAEEINLRGKVLQE